MSYTALEAKELRRLGVRHLFGVPGSGASYELLDACEREGIEFVLNAHEGAGAIMAGAGTRLTGRPGAAIAIKGPGVANLVAGIALASFENYPLLTFAEAYSPAAPAALQHKRMPQDAFLSALVKRIYYRSAGRSCIAEMAGVAREEPPGPVHLNLAEVEEGAVSSPSPFDRRAETEPTAMWRCLERVRRARRPALILGALVCRSGLDRDVQERLNGLHVPVFTTAAAKGAVDETRDCSAGVFTGAGADLAPECVVLPQADIVIGIGLRSREVLNARKFPLPYVAFDPVNHTHPGGFEADDECAADVTTVLPELVEALSERQWGLHEIAACHDRLRCALRTDLLLPSSLYDVFSRVRAGHVRLVTDSGNFTVVAEHVWRARTPADFLGSSNARFMGVALPQAVGWALADATRPVVCTIGDGGLPPFIAEMKIAIERRLPLAIVLVTDGHFGSIRSKIEERGWSASGVRINTPSWVRVFDAFGCRSARADRLADVESAFAAWDPAEGPFFLEAVVPEQPYMQMVKRLRW